MNFSIYLPAKLRKLSFSKYNGIMKNQSIKLIIIGCKDSSVQILSQLQDFNEIEVVGAYDSNHLVLAEFSKNHHVKPIQFFENIQKENYDGVIITTPSDTHFSLCHYFIEQNKYVFCKAPIIRNIDQYNKISNLPQTKKNLIYSFVLEKGQQTLEHIEEAIKSKEYGVIEKIKIHLSTNPKNFIFKNLTLISCLGGRLSRILKSFGQFSIGDVEVDNEDAVSIDHRISGTINTKGHRTYKEIAFDLSWCTSLPKNIIKLESDSHVITANLDKNILKIALKSDPKKIVTKLKFEAKGSGLDIELKNFLTQMKTPDPHHDPLSNEIDSFDHVLRVAI